MVEKKQISILAPYTPSSENDQAEGPDEAYLTHRARRRFSLGGKGVVQFSAEQIAALAKVNLKAASRVNATLRQGFQTLDQGQRKIHEALIDQNAIVSRGFDQLTLAVNLQREQQARDAAAQQKAVEALKQETTHQTQVVEKGFRDLAATVDMGMSSLLTQFELQRAELQAGLQRLEEVLKNQHKTIAQERFRDGQEAFGQYLRHPDEPRFLTDAEEYLRQSVGSYRGNPYAHLYLGHIYHEAGPVHDLGLAQEHYLACATYAKGLENPSLAAQGYFLAAWIAYVRRMPARALELGKLAVEYDPEGIPEAYFNLGKFHAHLEHTEEAIHHLDIAVRSFDPLYSLKASLDEDYTALGQPLDDFFDRLRKEEQAYWDGKLARFREA